jgi:UDP:flavonoid glycosyltransferase YjiC (YdhE family)
LTSLLAPVLQARYQEGPATPQAPTSHDIPEFVRDISPINILIQIIGSRGDVQPFIALGKVLRETYHHRVRVATHPVFKDFVEENGLEFFSLGGDPAELMAFMVKNPGLMPGMESLKAGDVTKRRKGMWEILLGGWRACIEQGNGMSYTPNPDVPQGSNIPGKPFVADAIIANPPSFGHIHCAERLGVPLHLMFTMPWSPTSAFPHPLANIKSSNAESAVTNFLSYTLVDMMTWQGLGDLVNKFRERTLGLDPISIMWAPGIISRLKVPHTYCWSPALIPKPHDWPSQINISGFYFLSLASSYQPPPDLERFLNSGPPPVYIGFGSIVVDDPDGLTNKILEAISLVGCRALVSKGWGGIGADDLNVPDNVMLLGNCPHDWLFPRCTAVVHHGGAGTTAAGISCGKPTVIVPFFGDQPFWGAMVAKAGAGPDPIPHKHLTAHNLAESIQTALSSEVQAKAKTLGESIRHETGSETGAKGFLSTLELSRCDLLPDRVAVWKVKGTGIKLSALAANTLLEAEAIEGGVSALRLWLHKLWPVDEGPMDPITGGASALMGSIGSIMMGVGDFPKELFKSGSKDKGKTVERPESLPSPVSDNQSHETPSVPEKSNSPHPDSPRLQSPSSTTEVLASKKLGEKEKQSTGFKLESALGATKSVQKVVGAGIRCMFPAHYLQTLLIRYSTHGFHSKPCSGFPQRSAPVR